MNGRTPSLVLRCRHSRQESLLHRFSFRPRPHSSLSLFFFLNDPPPPEIYTLPLHPPLPISRDVDRFPLPPLRPAGPFRPHQLAVEGQERPQRARPGGQLEPDRPPAVRHEPLDTRYELKIGRAHV